MCVYYDGAVCLLGSWVYDLRSKSFTLRPYTSKHSNPRGGLRILHLRL